MAFLEVLGAPTLCDCTDMRWSVGDIERSCFSISDLSSARLTCAFRSLVEVVKRPLS